MLQPSCFLFPPSSEDKILSQISSRILHCVLQIFYFIVGDHCDVTMRYDKQSCYHNDAQWVDTGHCVIWYCGHKTQHMVQSMLTHPVWSQNQVMTIHPELSDNKLNWCNISDKRITTFRSQSGFCPNHWNHFDFQLSLEPSHPCLPLSTITQCINTDSMFQTLPACPQREDIMKQLLDQISCYRVKCVDTNTTLSL